MENGDSPRAKVRPVPPGTRQRNTSSTSLVVATGALDIRQWDSLGEDSGIDGRLDYGIVAALGGILGEILVDRGQVSIVGSTRPALSPLCEFGAMLRGKGLLVPVALVLKGGSVVVGQGGLQVLDAELEGGSRVVRASHTEFGQFDTS